MSDHSLQMQTQVTWNFLFEHGNKMVKFFSNKTKKIRNKDIFKIHWWKHYVRVSYHKAWKLLI